MAPFKFEEKDIPYQVGQSIAGALFDSGIYGISHSKQSKKLRGAFCMNGDCCGCYVKVSDVQVLACRTPAPKSITVKRGGTGEI